MADTKGAVVIIEGSLTPAAGYLKRGEQAEVTYTDTVQELADGGFIKIVANKDAPSPIPVTPGNTTEATPVTPTVPQGTDQGLVEASPVAPAGNPVTPEVPQGTDQGLVDSGAAAGQAKSASTSTSRK